MFPNRFPSPGQYYYPPGQPQPQPSGNGSMLPQPRPGYMMYDSVTSPDFQHQANAGQMLMIPQQTTPHMYRFLQQQSQQQYMYVQQPNATPIQGIAPIQTQIPAQPVTSVTPVTPVTPPAVPITLSNSQQNDETPQLSSEKNQSSRIKNWKNKNIHNKDNETDKKN